MIMTLDQIITDLKLHANTQAIEGMARFGIRPAQALGVSIPTLRKMAKEIGRNHALALALWDSGIHEARILASMIDEPRLVSAQQMEEWVNDFDAWDVCDQVCGNLFDKTPYAYQRAVQWCQQEQEFVRRAGFVMMAELAVHDKQAPDEAFMQFFPLIKHYAHDERNFVKKAVNWALRQIGKRNGHLVHWLCNVPPIFNAWIPKQHSGWQKMLSKNYRRKRSRANPLRIPGCGSGQ
jgi:3-methyladenine DNA glycosylase AlkD